MNLNDYKIKDVKIAEIELDESDDLEHAGTKGMKWGQRRYQNPDGSLTPLGRIRYNKGLKKKAKEAAKSEKVSAKKEAKSKKKAEKKSKAEDIKLYDKLKKTKVSEMSDDDLKKYKDRMFLEAQAIENKNKHKQAKANRIRAFVDKIKNAADLLQSISSITESVSKLRRRAKAVNKGNKDKDKDNKKSNDAIEPDEIIDNPNKKKKKKY